MFCKNLIIYEINNIDDLNNVNNEMLKKVAFTPCSPFDFSKSGFISPLDNEELFIDMNGQMLLTYQIEKKVIPTDAIKRALNQKIEKQELALARKLTKSEKSSLRDEVITGLLTQALSKFNQFHVWVNKQDKFLAITTSSFKQAEDILTDLRKGLGRVALTPSSIDRPPEHVMTAWVKGCLTPPFAVGDQVELKDPLEGNGVISCKNQEINTDEIKSHFDSGKLVTKIKIIDERGVSYLLTNNFIFKNIKFEQFIINENKGLSSKEACIKANFLLASGILSKSIIELKKLFVS